MSDLTIHIKFSSSEKKLTVTVNTADKISVLKQKIAEQLKDTDTPLEPDQQILIYAGKILKNNDETIADVKIKDGNTIHMVKAKPKQVKKEEEKPVKREETETTTASGTASNTQTPVSTQPAAPQTTPSTTDNPFAQLGGQAGNPFAQLGFNTGFANAMNNPGANPFASMGGMGGMGGMPPVDPNMLNEMLNNPAILNMMSSMFQNPQMMDMLFNSSPQLAAFNTPQFRETMNRMMSNPETLRQILQFSNTYGDLLSSMGGGVPGAGANPFAAAAGATPAANTTGTAGAAGANRTASATNPPPMPDFSSLLGMLGGMGMPGAGVANNATAAANAASQEPPEVRYSTQLAQLQDMGFYDSAQNIRALTISGGRVEAAVEWLLNNPY